MLWSVMQSSASVVKKRLLKTKILEALKEADALISLTEHPFAKKIIEQ